MPMVSRDKAVWMMRIRSWAVTLVALMVATFLVDGIRYRTPEGLIAAAVLLGLMHEFVRPALLLLTLPLLLVTLTLFRFVINALLLGLVGAMVPGFEVSGFWSAFWGALIMSIVMALLSARPPGGMPRPGRPRHSDSPSVGARRGEDLGSGPVIDV